MTLLIEACLIVHVYMLVYVVVYAFECFQEFFTIASEFFEA